MVEFLFERGAKLNDKDLVLLYNSYLTCKN